MTKHDMGPLGVIDTLTDKELKETLGHHLDHAVRDWLRGLDYMQFAGQGNGTSTLTLPQAPESGYTWSYKLVACQLAAAGVVSIYPADTNGVAPVGVVTAIANGTAFDCVYTWSSNQLVLKDQRNLTLAASAIILNWRLLVLSVPTEMQGKL